MRSPFLVPSISHLPGAGPDAAPQPGLRELLRDAYDTNNRAWTTPGALAVGVHRIRQWAAAHPGPLGSVLGAVGKVGYVFSRNVYGIDVPATVRIGRRFKIAHQGGIVLHPYTVIGDDCTIRQGVTLGAGRDTGYEDDYPTIGDRVSLGAGAAVVGRVSIGDDVSIGPNAVVLSNVPAGSIVVSPASRIMGNRTMHPRPAKRSS